VTALKMARRLVRWYALRWGIECWHKALKVVCGVERRQMKEAEHLQRALALDMIIASRVLLLTRLGKEHPELPAELFYSAEELAVLAVKKKSRAATARAPS
jgi:transcriptional regulator